MSDGLVALIRTMTPILAGWLVSVLVTRGVTVGSDVESGLVVSLTSVFTAGYWLLASWLAGRWPVFGYLLVVPRSPTYPGVTDGE
jgi:cyanate permease